MNLPRFSLLLVLGLTAGIGVGCLNLKPQPDLTRFYVLSSPGVKAESGNPTLNEGLPVFLGRVEIPDYLQNLAMATRLNETEIEFSDRHYWAEPLREGMTRVLRDTLAARCGADRLHSATFRRPGGPYLEVQVAFTQFECTSQGSAVTTARWSLLRQPGSERMAGGAYAANLEFAPDLDDYRRAVEALSRCLAGLGEEVVETGLAPSGS
jgi:uncharacterized lipoprotein YmbA